MKTGEIVALSPVCKHLGCTVNWEGSEKNPDMFFCPCHNGLVHKGWQKRSRHTARGPLDAYPIREKDGFLMLGTPEANPFVRRSKGGVIIAEQNVRLD